MNIACFTSFGLLDGTYNTSLHSYIDHEGHLHHPIWKAPCFKRDVQSGCTASDLRTLQRTSRSKMGAESHMTTEIWSLTLEIIHLLTGKTYPDPQPGDHVIIAMSPPPSLTPDRHALQKILEVTRKITELLMVEMESPLKLSLEVKEKKEAEPVRREAEPVTREAGCSGAGRDLWSGLKMNPFKVTPVGSTLVKYGDESASGKTGEEESSHVIGADSGETKISNVKFAVEEKLSVMIKEEEKLLEISPDPEDVMVICVKQEEDVSVSNKEDEILEITPDGSYSGNKTKEHAAVLPRCENEEEDDIMESTEVPNTTNPHSALPSACVSPQPSMHSECHIVFIPQHKAQRSKKQSSCSPQRPHFVQVHAGETHVQTQTCSWSDCGNNSSDESNLFKPDSVHTGENIYSCSECRKSFSNETNFLTHKRCHTAEKPYSCAACGKWFSHKADLIKHARIHTGEKPYSCSVCGKRFSQKPDLIKHERVHTGEKPYSCSVCGKSFSVISNLMKHERVHTGEKPYACSECGKCFPQKSHLISHKRVHSGVKPYSCLQCGKSFSQKSHLSKHERVHTE